MLWGILTILSALLLLVAVGNFVFWPKIRQTNNSYHQLVSVLVPARNEEKYLAACLESILMQGAVMVEVLVYNDHSTDRTGQIIDQYAAQNPLVRSVPVPSLPAGWGGKNFACAQLARAAQAEWLLFLDADARLAPNAINRMLADAQARQLTFLSCWPKFAMYSWAEKILMPLLNFVVFSLYPSPLIFLGKGQLRTDPKLGLAHGACMLFERKNYEDFGGHETVKDQIFEDTRIAQLWNASGRNGLCLDGQEMVSLRMYSSFREIWFGFQKNIYPAFRHDASFWLFVALHFVALFCPFLLLLVLKSQTIALSVVLILLARLVLIIRFRHPLISVLFHPIGELILVSIALSSWWKCKVGRGVVWKGREYHKST